MGLLFEKADSEKRFEQSDSFTTLAKMLEENVHAGALFLHDFAFVSVGDSIRTTYL